MTFLIIDDIMTGNYINEILLVHFTNDTERSQKSELRVFHKRLVIYVDFKRNRLFLH